MDELVIILCTVPADGSADFIAEKIIENKLAACVNIIPGIKSIYYWDDKIVKDDEKIFFIKTLKNKSQAVYDFIKSNHPYSVTERLTLSVLNSGDDYAKWLKDYIGV